MQYYKLVVFVPETHADAVRKAIGEAGGGRLGNYSFASFSVKGIGRFKPEAGAHPAIGEVGRLEEAVEERIEVTCGEEVLGNIVAAVKRAHPYEEIAMDAWPLKTIN